MPLENVNITGMTKGNFESVVNSITVDFGAFTGGRKVKIMTGNSEKTVSFNEVYKALKEIANSQGFNESERVALSKAIVKLRQKDITSDKKWFLGKNIAKLAGKLLNPFNKQVAINSIEEKTGFSPKFLEASAKFMGKYPSLEVLTEEFLTAFIDGEGRCLVMTLTSDLGVNRTNELLHDWVTLCNEAMAISSQEQKKTIVSAVKKVFSDISINTSNDIFEKSASKDLQEAIKSLDTSPSMNTSNDIFEKPGSKDLQEAIKSLDTSFYMYDSFINGVRIRLNASRLEEIPEEHLDAFFKAFDENIQNLKLRMNPTPYCRIYVSDSGTADAGGPSREFLNNVMSNLLHKHEDSFHKIDGFHSMPQKRSPFSKEEYSMHYNIGKMMMYCYNSSDRDPNFNYSFGKIFNISLYETAMCLTSDEVDNDFKDLSLETKLKMAMILANSMAKQGISDYMPLRFKLLESFTRLNDAQKDQLVFILHEGGFLPLKFLDAEGNPNKEKIFDEKEQSGIQQLLIQSIFEQEGGFGPFRDQLESIHTVAKGMKSICHYQYGSHGIPKSGTENQRWNEICRAGAVSFEEKVQGSLDRQSILNSFNISEDTENAVQLEKKVSWMKDWIASEATEEELKAFLKYSLGTESLPKNSKIIIVSQHSNFLPIPRSHTCGFMLEISPKDASYGNYNDQTKENFITSLKELALTNLSGYQMI